MDFQRRAFLLASRPGLWGRSTGSVFGWETNRQQSDPRLYQCNEETGRVPYTTEVGLDGPMGSFTLHKNVAKPGVFLTGGIGITPFLNILRQVARDELSYQLYLFYSNRRPEDAVFMDALRELSTNCPGIHFIPSMTNVAKSQSRWTGETGHIDPDILKRCLPNLQGPIYYIAGPPGMVTAMRDMLPAADMDADDIRSEEYGGY